MLSLNLLFTVFFNESLQTEAPNYIRKLNLKQKLFSHLLISKRANLKETASKRIRKRKMTNLSLHFIGSSFGEARRDQGSGVKEGM
jgi:hypothetical protein